jgi:hypothetical protein
MAVLNRGVETIWDEESTGVNGASRYTVVGAQTDVAVHIKVSGATTIGFECAPSDGSVGFNTLPDSADAHTLYKKDGSGPFVITFASAGSATIDLSPFIPKFIRVTSTANVTATAVVEVVG